MQASRPETSLRDLTIREIGGPLTLMRPSPRRATPTAPPALGREHAFQHPTQERTDLPSKELPPSYEFIHD